MADKEMNMHGLLFPCANANVALEHGVPLIGVCVCVCGREWNGVLLVCACFFNIYCQ